MSSRIPQTFIDELISRTDIVELIDQHVPLKKKGKEYAACCPFHNEKTASFTVSPEKQFYHCFGCGAHGTALGFLMEYERLDFIEAIETLAQLHGLDIPQENTPYIKIDHQDLYDLLQSANNFFQQNLRQQHTAITYLKNRGVSGDIAAKFDLGYAIDSFDSTLNQFGETTTTQQLINIGLVKKSDKGSGYYDRFRNRIIFPIKDRRGRVTGFGGRVLDDAVPKYLNSPETPVFHKSDALYGLYEARKSKLSSRSLIVVEGYMDVVALAQHGIENVVATLGTATTGQHIQQLFRCTKEIIFCFDGDRAGREAAWRAAQQIIPLFKDGLEAKFLFLPQGEDPDSLIRSRGKEIFLEYIRDGESLSNFIFAKLSEDIDVRTPSGKARLANMAKPLLEKFPNGVFKKLIFKELEQKIGATIHLDETHPEQIQKPNPSNNKTTPVRLAVAALLHQPSLALEIDPFKQLEDCSLSGVPLLLNITRIWRQQPELSQAALLERFRGQPEEHQITKLLTWNPPELENPKQALFDAMSWIERKAQDIHVQKLIEKESSSGLSEGERQELKNLLHLKAS
ncbi:MAG: DNA primase [Pseudomonadota bacterium]